MNPSPIKYPVRITTNPRPSNQYPQLKCFHAFETRITFHYRIGYKLGSWSKRIPFFAMLPATKRDWYGNAEDLYYDIHHSFNDHGWKYWYPYCPWYKRSMGEVINIEDVV